MGYRSDIHIVLDAGTEENMNVLMLWFDNYKPVMAESGLDKEFIFGTRTIEFKAMDVKWYSSYSDVATVEKIVRDFENIFAEQDGYNFEYIRIGEDTTDIEERCGQDGFKYIYASRSIEYY